MTLVSVAMITYGHENFIEQAINGVLMQKCEFEIELIIANDHSPDNTDIVIKDIIDKHPNGSWIKYISREKNWGAIPNFVDTLNQCSGKYVAVCEGDDYWTDSLKLAKQVSFMEGNTEYAMIAHNAEIIYEGIDKAPVLFSRKKKSGELNIKDVINNWMIPTASMLFRRTHVLPLPSWVTKIYSADFTLALLLSHAGKIWFSNEIMSAYRVTFTGTSMSATLGKNDNFVYNQHILLLEEFNKETKGIYLSLIHRKISAIKDILKYVNLKEDGHFSTFLKMPKFYLTKMINKLKDLIN